MTLADLAARNLKTRRQTVKLSQQDLAQKAGISVSYVSMLERGIRTPPLATLEVLAKALRCNPLELLSRS